MNSAGTNSRIYRQCAEASSLTSVVYCLPYYGSRIAKVDPNTGTVTEIGPDLSDVSFPNATFGGLSGAGSAEAYVNNMIYFVPQVGANIYVIDPRDDSVTTIEIDTDRYYKQPCDLTIFGDPSNCPDVVLSKHAGYLALCQVPLDAPVNGGMMYSPPGHVGSSGEPTYALKLDPSANSAEELRDYPFDLGVPRSHFLLGQVMIAPAISCIYSEISGKIYSPPTYGDNMTDIPVIVIDPADDSVTTINTGLSIGEYISGMNGVAWSNGAYINIYAGPDGKLYSPPYSVLESVILVIDPATDTVSTLGPVTYTAPVGQPFTAGFGLDNYRLYYTCESSLYNNALYCVPDEASRILKIDMVTQEWTQTVGDDIEFFTANMIGVGGNFESAAMAPNGVIIAQPYFAPAGILIDPRNNDSVTTLGPWASPLNGAHTSDLKYVPTPCTSDADCRNGDACPTVRRKLLFGFYAETTAYCTPADQVAGFEEYRAARIFGMRDSS